MHGAIARHPPPQLLRKAALPLRRHCCATIEHRVTCESVRECAGVATAVRPSTTRKTTVPRMVIDRGRKMRTPYLDIPAEEVHAPRVCLRRALAAGRGADCCAFTGRSLCASKAGTPINRAPKACVCPCQIPQYQNAAADGIASRCITGKAPAAAAQSPLAGRRASSCSGWPGRTHPSQGCRLLQGQEANKSNRYREATEYFS